MESSILISELNDFIFCPKSIFWHHLYGRFHQSLYHENPQKRGSIHHESIDAGEYSSATYFLQGKEVYSEKYGISGKIDILDTREGLLIERKYTIKQVYEGYLLQLYAQYFCLKEMGYEVKRLALHSLSDNKRYFYDIPDEAKTLEFETLLSHFHVFRMTGSGQPFTQNPKKCARCIYRHLCDSCPSELL